MIKNIQKVALLTMLFSTVYVEAENLDEIHIKNNYGSNLSCTLYWEDRHGANTQQLQVVSVPTGHLDKFKAPFLGYGIARIVAGPNVYEEEYSGFQPGSISAEGSKFFEVNKGSQFKKTTLYAADISPYKDEDAYKAAQKTATSTTPNTANQAAPDATANTPAAPATT